MDNELSIKLFRLSTGEDIISSYIEDEKGYVIFKNPMKLIFRRVPTGSTVLVVLPWLPHELVKNDVAAINAHDIITILDLKDEMIEYYNNVVLSLEELDELNSGTLRERLFGGEEESEEVQSLDEVLKEKSKNIIH